MLIKSLSINYPAYGWSKWNDVGKKTISGESRE